MITVILLLAAIEGVSRGLVSATILGAFTSATTGAATSARQSASRQYAKRAEKLSKTKIGRWRLRSEARLGKAAKALGLATWRAGTAAASIAKDAAVAGAKAGIDGGKKAAAKKTASTADFYKRTGAKATAATRRGSQKVTAASHTIIKKPGTRCTYKTGPWRVCGQPADEGNNYCPDHQKQQAENTESQPNPQEAEEQHLTPPTDIATKRGRHAKTDLLDPAAYTPAQLAAMRADLPQLSDDPLHQTPWIDDPDSVSDSEVVATTDKLHGGIQHWLDSYNEEQITNNQQAGGMNTPSRKYADGSTLTGDIPHCAACGDGKKPAPCKQPACGCDACAPIRGMAALATPQPDHQGANAMNANDLPIEDRGAAPYVDGWKNIGAVPEEQMAYWDSLAGEIQSAVEANSRHEIGGAGMEVASAAQAVKDAIQSFGEAAAAHADALDEAHSPALEATHGSSIESQQEYAGTR